jgi:hypothetical protein
VVRRQNAAEAGAARACAHGVFLRPKLGRIAEVPASLEGPLATPTGPYRGMPAGVRAIVFSCASCGDPAEQFVAWLETPSQAIQRSGQALPPRPPSDIDEYAGNSLLVIRTPHDDRWHYFDSDAGRQIVSVALQRCEGKVLRHCEPRQRLVQDVDPILLREAQKALTSSTD